MSNNTTNSSLDASSTGRPSMAPHATLHIGHQLLVVLLPTIIFCTVFFCLVYFVIMSKYHTMHKKYEDNMEISTILSDRTRLSIMDYLRSSVSSSPLGGTRYGRSPEMKGDEEMTRLHASPRVPVAQKRLSSGTKSKGYFY